LRKERAVTQVVLARRAGVLLSLLSKIEVGDRALTSAIAAAIARALQISLGALYGEAEVSPEQSTLLEDLRTAVRRYDIPDQAPGLTTVNCASIWRRPLLGVTWWVHPPRDTKEVELVARPSLAHAPPAPTAER
jgi:transcriptional regulator with XRE-family HTH domain